MRLGADRPERRRDRARELGYRLVAASVLVGVVGAFAALAFDGAVHVAERLLIDGGAGYRAPRVGVLAPQPVVPQGRARLWIPVITTLGGLVSGILVYRFAPETEGHGTDAAIAGYHERPGEPRWRTPILKAVTAALTIGSGGVAGREGPTAQMSVGVGSLLARALGFRGEEMRILLLAAMAAGLAAAFQAPLGMAIFAVEILYSRMAFEAEALIFTVIAAVTGYAVHGFYSGWEPLFAIPRGLTFTRPLTLLGFVALGIAAGIVGTGLPWIFYRTRAFFRGLPVPRPLRPAVGGLAVGCLAVAVPEVLGTGYGHVEMALAGELTVGFMLLLAILKMPAMALTVGSGGSGGVFGPTVTVGALLGGVVGTVLDGAFPALGFVPAAFVVVGMASVFAGAARTPLATLIMTVEMTHGYSLLVPAMATVVVSFMVQRALTVGAAHPTLYESQVGSWAESPAHRGVLVRRAFDLVEGGRVDREDLTLPRLVSLLQFGEPVPLGAGDAHLVKRVVVEGDGLADRTVQESLGGIDGVTAVAVLRDDEVLLPRGPTRLRPGDEVVLVATPGSLGRLRRSRTAPEG